MPLKPTSAPPEVFLEFGRYVSKPILILCLSHRTKTPYWRVGVYSSGWEDEDRFDDWIDSSGYSLIDVAGWLELPETSEIEIARLTMNAEDSPADRRSLGAKPSGCRLTPS